MKETRIYQILCSILLVLFLAMTYIGIIKQPIEKIVYKEIPKLIEKECPVYACPDCVCPSEVASKEPVYCNEPSKYECDSANRVGNVSMSSINIKCSDGRIKVWDCNKNNWK